ncbi:hypothetical protein [uncultured Aeromicrobium sp.]|uniref:hypothetical protein n=1 Tax=uncultured Aeromicrobium sp. TaxID=337820 RepID=UPI0025ECD4E6|nr:hypothetical protein [uncultured Aeromicrobium sp.]
MRFYSPQANLDALDHPRVAAWLDFVTTEWEPTPVPGAVGRIGLLLPCTKYKPYVTSREHRAVNAALLAAGWRPVAASTTPDALLSVLDDDEDPAVLNVSPLQRDGVVLDRFVISEPLALVPYEEMMVHRGAQSPATSYDDPGLFENRGTSVSPERDDCTAVQRSNGTWSWGPAERQAYAEMHNAMAARIATALTRLKPHYRSMTAWVSPGLTHRSFLADSTFRVSDGLHLARRGTHGEIRLQGALDDDPGLVTILPNHAQVDRAKSDLRRRLDREGRNAQPDSARAIYARGDGHDTPLGLPELTTQLVAHLDREGGIR